VVTLYNAGIGIPAVILYFAKKLIVFHHARATRFVMIEMDKAAIAKLLAPAG
jgi:urease accessory protein UreH